jgi:tetratricopeptide (TPR) repeat protein
MRGSSRPPTRCARCGSLFPEPGVAVIRRLVSFLALLGVAPPLAAQLADGNRAWAAGRYDEARAAYERALAADPRSVRSLYRLAVLASWNNRLDSAMTLLTRARAIEPADPDVRTAEAQVLAWQGHLADARVRYDSLLAEDPDRRGAAIGRARVLGWEGRYAAADSAYALLLFSNPRDAEALAGRAQVARWRGRDRAAARYADQALAADPKNHDAAALRRELQAASGPRAELNGGWNNDSDHDTNWSESLTLSSGLAPGLRVFATGGLQQSTDPVREAHRSLGEGGVEFNAAGVRLMAAAGARNLVPDGAPSRSEVTFRAGAGITPAPGASVGVSFAHLPFDETAFLIGSGLDIDVLDGSLDLTLARGLTFSAGGGGAWVSDGNRRVSAVAAVSRSLGRHFFAGAYGRVLDYRQHGVGYFSPDRFGMGELRAGYLTSSHGWETRLSGGAGVQQTSGSSAQAEWHVEGRLARRWSTLNLVELFGGVTNSVASSVSGAFRYRTAGLRIVLTF